MSFSFRRVVEGKNSFQTMNHCIISLYKIRINQFQFKKGLTLQVATFLTL